LRKGTHPRAFLPPNHTGGCSQPNKLLKSLWDFSTELALSRWHLLKVVEHKEPASFPFPEPSASHQLCTGTIQVCVIPGPVMVGTDTTRGKHAGQMAGGQGTGTGKS
jgi:hypothetical protein